MAVKVEGMFASVVVVEDDLDDLILAEDEGIGIGTVDEGVYRSRIGGHGGVEGRDNWADVSAVIEKGTA